MITLYRISCINDLSNFRKKKEKGRSIRRKLKRKEKELKEKKGK